MAFYNLFNNTVIYETASKAHNLYVMALYDVNNNIFSKDGISYGSSVNSVIGGRFYPAYLWDLYKLSDDVSSISQSQLATSGHFQLSTTMPWRTLYAKDFSDNSGSEIYQQLNNFLPLNVNNHPVFSAQNYSGNFSFSPLININVNNVIQSIFSSSFQGLNQFVNDQAAAELVMYFASKIPLYPLMVCSSINSHYSFGPVFLSSMNINVGGKGSLGLVNIDCSFTGGKAIISPEIDLFKKRRPSFEPVVYNSMNDLQGNEIPENATNFGNSGINFDYHRYRSASLLDVIVYKEYFPNFQDLIIEAQKPQITVPKEKIINVSLNISQTIDLDYTIPRYDDIEFNDSFGPRFASLRKRTVSGSITYYGFTEREKMPRTSGLTLYFGGPFYYPMKNVDWSNPTINIDPGGGYTHTYNFIARLPEGVNEIEFPFSGINPDGTPIDENENLKVLKKNVSEFTYDSYTFNSQDYVEDYISSWIRNIVRGFGIDSL